MIAFATGGLLGDVFFHTLPHMSTSHSKEGSTEHSHDHGHDHRNGHAHSAADMENNLIIIIGIVTFFLLEKVTQSYLGGGH